MAVIDQGELKAEGSPLSLKKEYASGYQLFLERLPGKEAVGGWI